MIGWTFSKDDLKYDIVPAGNHRVRIEKAEEAQSKTGKDMIKLELAVSGTNSKLFHYVVFPSPSDPKFNELKKYTNRNLDKIRDSFDIPDRHILENLNINGWVGKVGAANVKEERNEQTGEMNSKVAYFIRRDRQAELPAWKEPSNSGVKSAPIMPDALAQAGLDEIFPPESLQGEF